MIVQGLKKVEGAQGGKVVLEKPFGESLEAAAADVYKRQDQGGIDVWVGNDSRKQIDAIMCIVDLMKRDSEIKILIGCTEEEKEIVCHTHNETEYMKGILIRR